MKKKQLKKHHAKKHHPRTYSRQKRKKPMHYFKVFFLYTIALGALAAWIDVTSYGVFDVLKLSLTTLLVSLIATLIHWYSGKRDRFDDIADGDL